MPDKPLKCHPYISDNTSADIEGVDGYGMPYTVTCTACIRRRTTRDHKERKYSQNWAGPGFTYAATWEEAEMAVGHHKRAGYDVV